MMSDREKVIEYLNSEIYRAEQSVNDIWLECVEVKLLRDVLELLKEQEEERRRLLTWLGKFCRHIDNGDKWLMDEENLAFFKEKMKQQFGWEVKE